MIFIKFAVALLPFVQCDYLEKHKNEWNAHRESKMHKMAEEMDFHTKAKTEQVIRAKDYDSTFQQYDAIIRELYLKIQEQDVMNRAQGMTIQQQDTKIQGQGARIQEQNVRIQGHDARNQEQDTKIQEQDAKIQQQSTKNQEQDAKIQEQDAKIQEQDTKIQGQDKIIISLKTECAQQQIEGSGQSNYSLNTKSRVQPDTNMYPAFACEMDNITLSCTNGRTINVTSGYYGQYLQTCSGTCCPPHPDDCRESMEENAPGDWYVLTTTCNNKSSCAFQNPGQNVYSCEEPYDSNYGLVYYSCLPDDETEPSAFTASTNNAHDYTTEDVVIFDVIVTNVGNNYLAETSTYVCPRSGLYVFSVTVFNNNGYLMVADLMCEEKQLATVYSYPTEYHQGVVTAVTECALGEQVWVQSTGNYRAHDDSNHKYNIFSGFLLQPY